MRIRKFYDMEILIATSDRQVALASAGAARLGMELDEALLRPGEPNVLLDMVTAMARERGVPVPPLREVAEAIAPVIREELEKLKSERLS